MRNTYLSFAQWQAEKSLLQPCRFRRQASSACHGEIGVIIIFCFLIVITIYYAYSQLSKPYCRDKAS